MRNHDKRIIYLLMKEELTITRNKVTFLVTEIRDDIVYMDRNHPLSGQSLHFEVEIQGIRDATAEEIRSGKAIA